MSVDKSLIGKLVDLAPTARQLEKQAEELIPNRVEQSFDGSFHVFWRGRPVFEKHRLKRFESEEHAQQFLDLSDSLGKIALLD